MALVDSTRLEAVAATVIDCEQLGRGFYIHENEGNDSVLEGLTVTHGYKTDHHGGGIFRRVGPGPPGYALEYR